MAFWGGWWVSFVVLFGFWGWRFGKGVCLLVGGRDICMYRISLYNEVMIRCSACRAARSRALRSQSHGTWDGWWHIAQTGS